jgi:hypothetical protein
MRLLSLQASVEYESGRSYNTSYAYHEHLTLTTIRRYHHRRHIRHLCAQLLQTVEPRRRSFLRVSRANFLRLVLLPAVRSLNSSLDAFGETTVF